VDDENIQHIPEDIAARIDRRGVMLEAAEHVAELHHATTRLGDALDTAGLPGRVWRTDEASLSLLDEDLPDVTVDELITRMAEFAADTGPAWLHGDRRDLDEFHHEVTVLRDVVGPLRKVAHRLRMQSGHDRSELPLERAFGHVRVATPLDMAAAILRDLELLAPVMAPLAPEEWDAQRQPARAPARSAPAADVSAAAPPPDQSRARLRDFVPPHSAAVPDEARRYRTLVPRLLQQSRALGPRLAARKWLVTAGIVAILASGIAIAQSVERLRGGPTTELTGSPSRLTLTCSARPRALTLTLTNPSKVSLAWQATAPSGWTILPGSGTLTAGQSVALRITAAPTRQSGAGAIVIAATDGAAEIPYTIACH
jgi:Viral BACON domain